MKRLIICADGTWDTPDIIRKDQPNNVPTVTQPASSEPEQKTLYNKPIRESTNVVKMARAINPTAQDGTTQVVFYDMGVGTGMGFYDKFIGGGFGVGLSNNVLQCYRFLVDNYDAGDDIFLFGFSRGAFTVRSLAGMLNCCGLLTKDDAYYISEAYEQYLLGDKNPARASFLSGKGFRKRNHPSREVKIKFIGVWDTVGALGLPFHNPLARAFNKRYAFHDVQLSPSVEFAYQALAIDEWREPFQATLWNPKEKLPANQTMEQRWFAGCHTNVGGSMNGDRFRDASGNYHSYRIENYAFQWMVAKATAPTVGLECNSEYLQHFKARPDCTIRNTHNGIYKLWKKYLRPIGMTKYGNETIDESVRERMAETVVAGSGSKYEPTNLIEFLHRSGNP